MQDTPEKPVKEVWDVADKAKPPPPKRINTAPASSSPAQKPVVPSSPVVPTPITEPAGPALTYSRSHRRAEDSAETTTLRHRTRCRTRRSPARWRYLRPTQPATPHRSRSVNLLAAQACPPATFQARTRKQQLSRPVALHHEPSRAETAAASVFLAQAAQQTRGGAGGIQIQGAASQQPPPPRPGTSTSTGIPRGGGAPSGIARGGRGGAQQRGGSTAGQKRSHDGSEGGDGKRMRGGGPSGS